MRRQFPVGSESIFMEYEKSSGNTGGPGKSGIKNMV